MAQVELSSRQFAVHVYEKVHDPLTGRLHLSSGPSTFGMAPQRSARSVGGSRVDSARGVYLKQKRFKRHTNQTEYNLNGGETPI